jgi:Mg-chelatase subunit ChlD
MGGTPTAPAILMAHDRLARRKERRHVLFVLTDGESDDSTVTRAAVKAVEQCGVTVIGIGIGTAAVKREFAHWATIGSAVELPALMLSKLTNIILGEKSKKGMDVKEVQKKRHFTA